MKHQQYKEIKGKEILRKVSITEELAKRLNADSQHTGVSYQLIKEKK